MPGGRIDQCAVVDEGLIGPRRVDVGIADTARRPGTDVLAPVLPVKTRGAFHDLSVLRLYDSIWRGGEDFLYIDIKNRHLLGGRTLNDSQPPSARFAVH